MADSSVDAKVVEAQVPLVDEQGDAVLDEDGNPVKVGMSTGKKVAIGAGVLVGATAVAALGVGALAAGGYYMYQSHESKKQNESPTKLVIRALSGHGLKSEDFGGKSDPFLRVELGRVSVKTKTCKDTVDPEWNEEMTIGFEPEHYEENIKISVHDEDTGRSDESLGKGFVSFAQVPANRVKRFEVALDKQGSVRLELYVTGPGAKDGARCTPPPKRRADDERKGGRRKDRRDERDDNDEGDGRRRRRHGRDDDDEEEEDRKGGRRRRSRSRSPSPKGRGGRGRRSRSRSRSRSPGRGHGRGHGGGHGGGHGKGRRNRRGGRRDEDSDDHRRGRRAARRTRGSERSREARGLDISDGDEILLKHADSGLLLQLTRDGDVDADGRDDKWATFEVCRERGENRFRLVSVGDDRNWLGIDDEGAFGCDEEDATEFIGHTEGRKLGLECAETHLWVGVRNGRVFTKTKKRDRVGKGVAFEVLKA